VIAGLTIAGINIPLDVQNYCSLQRKRDVVGIEQTKGPLRHLLAVTRPDVTEGSRFFLGRLAPTCRQAGPQGGPSATMLRRSRSPQTRKTQPARRTNRLEK